MGKYRMELEAETIDELFEMLGSLRDQPIHTLPKANKVTVEMGDSPEPEPEPEPEQEAPADPVITLEEVQKAFADKARANRDAMAHLKEILKHYGANKVSNLDPISYADVLAEIKLVEV